MIDEVDDVPSIYVPPQFVDVDGINNKFKINNTLIPTNYIQKKNLLKIIYALSDILTDEEKGMLINVLSCDYLYRLNNMIDNDLHYNYNSLITTNIYSHNENLEFNNLNKLCKLFNYIIRNENETFIEIIINRLDQILNLKQTLIFIQLFRNYNVYYRFIKRKNLFKEKILCETFIMFRIEPFKKNDIRFYLFYQKYLSNVSFVSSSYVNRFVLSCINDNVDMFIKYCQNMIEEVYLSNISMKQIIKFDSVNILSYYMTEHNVNSCISLFYMVVSHNANKCFMFLNKKFHNSYEKIINSSKIKKFIKKVIKRDNIEILEFLYKNNTQQCTNYIKIYARSYIMFYEKKYTITLYKIRNFIKKIFNLDIPQKKINIYMLMNSHMFSYENMQHYMIKNKFYKSKEFFKIYNKYKEYATLLINDPLKYFEYIRGENINAHYFLKTSQHEVKKCIMIYIVEQYYIKKIIKKNKLSMIMGIELGLNPNEPLKEQPFGIISLDNLFESLSYV